MFTKNTVLVLGAGASCHYGYPTGEGLIDRIVNTIKTKEFPSGAGSEKMTLQRFNSIYGQLCERLEFYDPLSIDNFLSECTMMEELVRAGKTMIAYEILQAEDKNWLKRFHPSVNMQRNENWYRFLIHALTSNASPDELIEKDLKVKIITFNYDISLEYSLFSRFMNAPLFGSRAAPFLKKISDNIIHMYGQVGKFKWKGGDGDRADDDYGSYKDLGAFNAATGRSSSIYIIGQDRKNIENAELAQKWLSEAECIYFLGFGFNDDNIKLLGLPHSTNNGQEIYCTNYDGSNEGSKIVQQKIKSLFVRGNRIPETSSKTVFQALVGDFLLTQ